MADRCPNCDRADCKRPMHTPPIDCDYSDCYMHSVNWRERCKVAEDRLSAGTADLWQWRDECTAIEGRMPKHSPEWILAAQVKARIDLILEGK